MTVTIPVPSIGYPLKLILMKRYTLFFLILSVFSLTTAQAQTLPSGPQVLTFFSSLDDTEQPYGLYLPPSYDPQKKYPLVIMLHGAGSNHRLALRRVFGKSNANGENDVEATRYFPEWKDVEFIVASPYARGTAGYQGIAEKDVYDVLADVKKRFNVDEDRTYLTGLSMGGGGTLWIGLTRPDVWAALAPVCPAPPAGTDQYAMNSFNLPVHFFHGDADKAVPVSVSRDWVKNLRDIGTKVEYIEYPGVEHNSWENAYKDESIFTWFSQFKRNKYPDHIKFSTAVNKYNKAYWLKVDHISSGNTGKIEAKFTQANQLDVTASGVSGFTITLKDHPKYTSGAPLQLMLNGKKQKVSSTDSISFVLKDGKWVSGKYSATALTKKAGAEGPISDAFSQRHIYVYGTMGSPTPEEIKSRMDIAFQAANWSVYRNAFLGRIMFFPRIVADRDVRPSDLESCNLILFGTKETNSIIQQYEKQLPMHLNGDQKDVSLVYVYPVNGHYIVVNSGIPWWNTPTPSPFPAIPAQALGRAKDFLLFRNTMTNMITEGYFDDNWKVSEEQKKVLKENGVSLP
jgi:poly(3-hydroxybutyrate) depolymerase